MTITLIIIGWLACAALTCVCIATAQGRVVLIDVVFCIVGGPLAMIIVFGDEIVIWQRKPRDGEE